jgi:PTH1 family peptidyl-tRNA hydrolase
MFHQSWYNGGMKLIFAQGNPDPKYAKTRHNTGFNVLDAFGEQHDALWKDVDKFTARIAELSIDGEKVILVKPSSYYNDTGTVARKLTDFYKLDAENDVLVIHDDLALPLGTIRIREKGGDAGNNGVKSLNTHLGTNYPRIRIGIWTDSRDLMDDVDFVLGSFSKKEQKKLEKEVIPHTLNLITDFLQGKLETTSHTL